MTMSAVDVVNAHPNTTVLTVDFFDTMVTRTVAQPTHVFAVMEQSLVQEHGSRWAGVALARVQAEHRARMTAAKTDSLRDITIEEIAAELAIAMNLSSVEKSLVIASEKATEVSLAKAVPAGTAIIAEAQARGLRVLIVSDNYMPADHLVAMAHAVGIDIKLLNKLLYALQVLVRFL